MHSNGKIRIIMILGLLMGASVMIFSGCASQQFKTGIFQQNDMEGGWGPNGLVWNGRDLVMGDSRLVMDAYDIETGSFWGKDSVYNSNGFFLYAKTPDSLPRDMKICGLAWEGECCGKGFLWIADSLNKEIVKLDSENKIAKRLPAPGDMPNGLAFDGSDLWVADSMDSKIYVVSTDDGTVVREFNSPVKDPAGLAWDCGNLWITGLDSCKEVIGDCNSARLVKLDVGSGKVTHEVELPKHIKRPTALEWVNGTLWVGDYNLNRVFKISDKSAKAVKDNTVYATPVTAKQRRLIVEKMTPMGEAELMKEEAVSAADEAKAAATEAKSASDEAKTAATDAKTAAGEAGKASEEAKTAAEKSEKAFELQLKK
jgi:hypothetical protein